MPPTEGCRSGRTGRSRKPLRVQALRGFKSLPLRLSLRRALPGELRFDPAELTAEAGSVTFRFDNTQSTPRDVVIEKNGEPIAGTDLISNDSQDVTVQLDAGDYTFICTPHESAGMTGTLKVS
jgi:plastocyanin